MLGYTSRHASKLSWLTQRGPFPQGRRVSKLKDPLVQIKGHNRGHGVSKTALGVGPCHSRAQTSVDQVNQSLSWADGKPSDGKPKGAPNEAIEGMRNGGACALCAQRVPKFNKIPQGGASVAQRARTTWYHACRMASQGLAVKATKATHWQLLTASGLRES